MKVTIQLSRREVSDILAYEYWDHPCPGMLTHDEIHAAVLRHYSAVSTHALIYSGPESVGVSDERMKTVSQWIDRVLRLARVRG